MRSSSGAQLVLVHHGLFWKFHPTGLTPLLAERLRPLFKHDINLVGYHLPLDAHPEVGNNALLAHALGCVDREPFGDYKGRPIGSRGRFPEPLSPAELGARVAAATGREPLLLGNRATASPLLGSSRVPPLTRCTRRRRSGSTRFSPANRASTSRPTPKNSE